jgi:hypothetical protein
VRRSQKMAILVSTWMLIMDEDMALENAKKASMKMPRTANSTTLMVPATKTQLLLTGGDDDEGSASGSPYPSTSRKKRSNKQGAPPFVFISSVEKAERLGKWRWWSLLWPRTSSSSYEKEEEREQ